MDFNYSKKSLDLQKKLNKFFEDHIYPNEQAYDLEIEESGNSLHIPGILDNLKDKAKEEGLWNLFLPDSEYGAGLTNVPDYVFESDYDLKSLSYVETFVSQSLHLPNVPGRDDLEGW